MLKIRAFQGLTPAPTVASAVACVPYDVVNREEAAALAQENPLSLLHVDRAEIDLPEGTDAYAGSVYDQAKATLDRFVHEGTLLREDAPKIYLYRQRMGGHVQTGVVAVCHIEDYENDVIRKHEKTRKDKEDDRTRLIGTLSANTGPVFLPDRGRAEIDALVALATAGEPTFDFTASDGIQHTLWRIDDPAPIVQAFGAVPLAYVADGHHRSASAVRVGRERRNANPHHTGQE
ncbi:DUF1015 domain-containing protein, partial [bacterium]|nr:DUF1015 domain-containing protein [bacterium]